MTAPPKPSTLLGQVQRFSLVGVLNTLVDFLVFTLLVQVGLHYVASQAVSYGCGLVSSFLLNRSWTFRSQRADDRLLVPRFLIVNLCAWAVLELALLALVGRAGLPAVLGKVLATPLSLAVNFLGNRYWVFRADSPALSESAEPGVPRPRSGRRDT
jgi:putative flippase GtrA